MTKKDDPKTLAQAIQRLLELETQVNANSVRIEELKLNVKGEFPKDPPLIIPS